MLSMGCSMGINDAIENLVANLAEVKPTILFAVPRIFNRIYDGVNKQMAEQSGVHSEPVPERASRTTTRTRARR